MSVPESDDSGTVPCDSSVRCYCSALVIFTLNSESGLRWRAVRNHSRASTVNPCRCKLKPRLKAAAAFVLSASAAILKLAAASVQFILEEAHVALQGGDGLTENLQGVLDAGIVHEGGGVIRFMVGVASGQNCSRGK